MVLSAFAEIEEVPNLLLKMFAPIKNLDTGNINNAIVKSIVLDSREIMNLKFKSLYNTNTVP